MKLPQLPLTDKPILADYVITNPGAPEWSEAGSRAIRWSAGDKTWCRLSDGMPLQQAPGDVVTITDWEPLPFPRRRSLSCSTQ